MNGTTVGLTSNEMIRSLEADGFLSADILRVARGIAWRVDRDKRLPGQNMEDILQNLLLHCLNVPTMNILDGGNKELNLAYYRMCMIHCIEDMRREDRMRSAKEMMMYQAFGSLDDDGMEYESEPADPQDIAETIHANIAALRFIKTLEPQEHEILTYFALGYNQEEIHRLFHIRQQKVSRIKSIIMDKLAVYADTYGYSTWIQRYKEELRRDVPSVRGNSEGNCGNDKSKGRPSSIAVYAEKYCSSGFSV